MASKRRVSWRLRPARTAGRRRARTSRRALISRRVDGDEDLAAAGVRPAGAATALIDHAVEAGESADIWRDALGEEETAPTGRPVDLNSDEPEAVVRSDAKWTSDPLGIRPDVASFAALLASRSLEPPLSIGLFGPWGSGKTTFLKRLRLAIDERAEAGQEAIWDVAAVAFVATSSTSSSTHGTSLRTRWSPAWLIRSFGNSGPSSRTTTAGRRRCWPISSRKWRPTRRRKVEEAKQKEAEARKAVEDAADRFRRMRRRPAREQPA